MDNNIGKIICEKRKQKGLTQKELASILGVMPSIISNWENNRSKPNQLMINKLSQIFEIDLQTLDSSHVENEVIEAVIKDFTSKDTYHTKLFYSIVLCILFCLMAYVLYSLDIAPIISYVIFCLVFCIFVIFDLICYK